MIVNKEYSSDSYIKIINPKQAAYFCSKGIELQGINLSIDYKTNEPIFVFVFLRNDTKKAFDEWCKRKN